MNTRKGFLALLTTGLIYGSFGILIRTLDKELLMYQQIFLRNLIAFLFAGILVIILKQKFSYAKTPKKHLFFYAFSYPLAIIFFVASVLSTKIAVTVFSYYIGLIIFSTLIGFIFLKEKLTRFKIISMIFVLIGLIFFSMPLSITSLNLGLFMGLLSGSSESITNTFRKLLGGNLDRFVLVAIQMLSGIIISGLLLIIFKQAYISSISSISIILSLLFGIFLMSVSYLTLVGFQSFDLNLGAIVISSELIFASLFAAIFFKEYPTVYESIGGAFVLLAIITANLRTGVKKI